MTNRLISCEPFKSYEAYFGETFENTKILYDGEYCNIDIDAQDAVARVSFQDTVELGVLFNRYSIGETITIPKGQKQTITVYNGKMKGPIAYTLTFSNADSLKVATFALLALFSYF